MRYIINIIRRGKFICSALFTLMIIICPGQAFSRTYEECLDSIDFYVKVDRLRDAERLTIEALRMEPANKSNWLLWSNLGEIRNRLGDAEGALEAYDIGISRNPKSLTMLNNRASLYINEGRIDEAMTDLNSSLAIDPAGEWPLLMRGMLNFSKKDYKKAEADMNSLAKHHPGNAQAYVMLARIRLVEGDVSEALKLCDKALETDADEDTWFLKISTLIEADRLPEASDNLREAMKSFPRRGNLFLLRAWIHKKSFQNKEADIDKKLALEYGADPQLIEEIFPEEPKNSK